MWQQLLEQIKTGDKKALARAISFVENEQESYQEMLMALKPEKNSVIIGITGAPGAGKSTLVDGLIGKLIKKEKRVAVLCVDPSSPFHLGAVLGDRIRMSQWYTNPSVFIRSLATRGSLGGLHPKIIEISELVKASGYDYIIIETVGVGQSEIEIAGLADTTVVVLVPEGGDEVQTMKAGLMEIADVFVVNKSDRPGADLFVKNIRTMLAPAFSSGADEIVVIKTIAHENTGLNELLTAIEDHGKKKHINEKKLWLLTEKAFQLIQKEKMKGINKNILKENLQQQMNEPSFNIYSFALKFENNSSELPEHK